MKTEMVGLKDLDAWAASWSSQLTKRQILLFDGPMGAGKTTLIQSLLKAIDCFDVQSPTYSIINEYQSLRGAIHHIDLYRLKSEEDLDSVGFWDLFSQSEGLILIEWAELLNDEYLPKDWQIGRVRIAAASNGLREIQLDLG